MKSKKYQVLVKFAKGMTLSDARDFKEEFENYDGVKSTKLMLVNRKPRTPKAPKIESTPIAGNTKFRNYFQAKLISKEYGWGTVEEIMECFDIISSKLL